MGPADKYLAIGVVIHLIVRYVIPSGFTVSAAVCFRFVDYILGNDKNGGRNACRIPLEHHGEEGAENQK